MPDQPKFDINTLNRESEFVTAEGYPQKLDVLDENKQRIRKKEGGAYEYVSSYVTRSTTRIPKEILVTGDVDILKAYIAKNPHHLTEGELRHLNDRVRVMEHIKKVGDYHNTENHKPKRKIVKKDVNGQRAYIIDGVKLERAQSTGMGCWSCSLELQLQSRGVKLEQELIRRYKPEFKHGEGPVESPKEIDISNGNSMNEIYQNSEIVGEVCPNTMVKKMDISRDSVNKEKIINKVKSVLFNGNPVSFCNGAHWLTIVGFDRNNQFYYYDSNDHQNPGQLKVKSFDIFKNGRFDFTWLEDIEIDEAGKMKNVPKEYFDVDKSGTVINKINDNTDGAFIESSAFKKDGNFVNANENGIPISTYIPHSIRYFGKKDYEVQKKEIEDYEKSQSNINQEIKPEQKPEEQKYSFMNQYTSEAVNRQLEKAREEKQKLLKKQKEEEEKKKVETKAENNKKDAETKAENNDKKNEDKTKVNKKPEKSLMEELLEAQKDDNFDYITSQFEKIKNNSIKDEEVLFDLDENDKKPPVPLIKNNANNQGFGNTADMDYSAMAMTDIEISIFLETGQIPIRLTRQKTGFINTADIDYFAMGMTDSEFNKYMETGQIPDRSVRRNAYSNGSDYMSDAEFAKYLKNFDKTETAANPKKPDTSSETKEMAKTLNSFVKRLNHYSVEDKQNVAADSEAYGYLKKSVGILSDYYNKWKSIDKFPKEIKEEAKALWKNIRQNALSSVNIVNGIIDEYGSMEVLEGTDLGYVVNGKKTLCQQIADAAAKEAEKFRDIELERKTKEGNLGDVEPEKKIKSEADVISKIDSSITNDKKHKLEVVEDLRREMGFVEFSDIESNINDFRERYSWAVSNIVELMVEGIKKEKEANPDKTDIDFSKVKIQIGKNDLASLAACTFAENLAEEKNFKALKKKDLPDILFETAMKFEEFDNSKSSTIEFALETFFSGGKLYKTFGNKIEEAYKEAMSKQIEEKQNSVTGPKDLGKGEKVKTENKKTEPEKTESETKEVKSLNNDETVKQLV